VPIKTKIEVNADVGKAKESLALLEKYRTALKGQYGPDALKAPYVHAASAAGQDLSKFIDYLDKAAGSESRFSAAAQKAGSAFQGLASGVKHTLENLARYALSPLQLLFPAGLAVGVAGLGLGLAGVAFGAGLYGLDSAAAGVSDRRRRALGLGVSYGSLSAYDLDFSRFGAGAGTLGAVAGGIYDFTSPEYLGLRSAGATGHGDTAEAAVDLIRRIPELLQGVPDSMVGPVARSRNLTSILDLPTIIRLRQHPDEIEAQVKRYQQDKKSFNISAESQERWASFTAAIERAGRDIETVLGKNLVALTPGLTKFSDDAVKFIDAFVDSRAMTNALKGIEGGLQWLEGCIGSSEFKHGAKQFLSGLETLGPYIANFVDYAAKVLRIAGRGAYYGAKIAGDPSYNPSLSGLVGDALGVAGQDAPHRTSTGLGGSSIRYYAGRGKERPPYGGVIDQSTGKLLPRPAFKYSGGAAGEGGGRGWNASVGDIPADVLATVQAANPNLTPRQCVELVQSTMGVGNVHDWRRGPSEKDAPAGAALATFGYHGESEFYALGGSGTPGIGRDHALKLIKKYPDGSFDAVSQDIGHSAHLIHMPFTGRGGEGDASSYYAIFDKSGRPAGENSKLFAGQSVSMPAHPRSPAPAPSAAAADDDLRAMQREVSDNFDEMQRNRNAPLKRRGGHQPEAGGHILDHVHQEPPPGPIIINDMTGGSALISVSRHEASQ
jgi:hypothetical protein